MNKHLKQMPKNAPKFLTLVVNIVFYHGKETPYVHSCDLFDYFEEPDLARELMFKPFTLIDVNQIPDDELAKHKWAALFQLMQKHSRERDMLPFLEKLLRGELKIEVNDYEDLLYVMVKYLAETGEVSDKKRVIDLLKQAVPEGDDKMTTLAQDWYQDGVQFGTQKGIQQGMERGEHEKALTIAKNMMMEKVDLSLIKKVTGLTDQNILKITQNH